ncbi:MAG: phage Gp37/Gp68 family protein [Christensenellales bacterium]
MAKSKIEWTESTWNPITGCTKISAGCENCYACRMALRLQKMGNAKYANGFDLTLHESCLSEPYYWKKPSRIFVNSMSDLFHDDVPVSFIKKVFDVMNNNQQHTFQLLTKRAERLSLLANTLQWSKNIWMGVTVENIKNLKRIEHLRKVPSEIRFISFEPLLESIGDIDLSYINWAIVGGESGWHARKIEESWILSIKEQCDNQGCLFYFKQWGGTNKKKSGRLLLGRTWDDMPELSYI